MCVLVLILLFTKIWHTIILLENYKQRLLHHVLIEFNLKRRLNCNPYFDSIGHISSVIKIWGLFAIFYAIGMQSASIP